MTKLIVIDPVDTTHEGPTVPVPNSDKDFQPLHLRQGDIDGACGPYCLFMALMICGLAKRDEITGESKTHGNSSLSKAFKLLEEYSVLFRDGTNSNNLQQLLNKSYKSKLKVERSCEQGAAIRPFIEKQIHLNHPVMLRLDWGAEAGHWVLVIGLEYVVDGNGNEIMWRLLLLDPSNPPSNVCAWNGVIEAKGGGGIHPFLWWGNDLKVQLAEGIALMPM